MVDSKKQPTVLIKKPDGTTERVSLSVFRERKKAKAEVEIKIENESDVKSDVKSETKNEVKNEGEVKDVVVKEDLPRPVSMLPQNETPHELSTTTPVKNIFVDEAEASLEWGKDDSMSLLDGDMSEVEDMKERGAVHETHKDIAQDINSEVGVPKELQSRLASLVISFNKGIRTEHQFLDYAMREVEQGGLGMTEVQAQKLLESTKKEKENKSIVSPKPVVLPRQVQAQTPVLVEPAVEQEEPILKPQPVPQPLRQGIPNILPTPQARAVPKAQPPLVKHDIEAVAEKSHVQGPEDEARNFTLTDLRRLSRDPEVAVDMLLAKFEGWKEETFLLYMKTRVAWKASPLNKIYTDTTAQALKQGVSIQDILNQDLSGEHMTLEEYNSVVLFNSRLVI